MVYIGHHDEAYLWASKRLQGFDAANAKPAYEYFEQSKPESIMDETPQKLERYPSFGASTDSKPATKTNTHAAALYPQSHHQPDDALDMAKASQIHQAPTSGLLNKIVFALCFFPPDILVGFGLAAFTFLSLKI